MYDDWLLEARAELERQCVDLCDLLGAARARAGDLAGAAIAARRRIQLQPLEETGYRALMQLQADLGDRAGGGEHLPPLRLGAGARAGRDPGARRRGRRSSG